MDHLNWGYIQLGLVALAFGGLLVWWISSVFWRRDLAKPQSGGEFRVSLERIWKKEQRQSTTTQSLTLPLLTEGDAPYIKIYEAD